VNDRHELQEMTGAVSLGVLAEEMVLAVGKLRREESLAARDLDTITGGEQLLQRLSSDTPSVLSPVGIRHMGSEAALLDVFRAVRLRAPDQPVREFLRKLAEPLGRAARSEALQPSDRELLPEIQALFVQIGELTLARTNDLFDRGRKEPFGWMGNTRGSAS